MGTALCFDIHREQELSTIRNLTGERFRKLPIIALIANAIAGAKEMFLENGFNDYLTKPINPQRLSEILEMWIPMEKKNASR